jgi:nitrate/TMAO reductase-like tetraheme cytochrome c subunit
VQTFYSARCGNKEDALKEFDETCCRGLLKLGVGLMALLWMTLAFANDAEAKKSYLAAKWNPIHFKPAIDRAEDKDCLTCHAEVLTPSVREYAPAGVQAGKSMAWYQTLDTYSGDQDTLHRRHMSTDYAKRVMNMRCNTCHQGHDPRAEAPGSSATSQPSGYNLRKLVDTNTCLMCHGKFNYEVMGLPGPWSQYGETFANNCLLCHDNIRTSRHKVNFLKPAEIEAAGKESADSCYGCHGGRAWYRINFPYPRHAWKGMDKEIPEWAKNRPTQSDPRFLIGLPTHSAATQPKPVKSSKSAKANKRPGKTIQSRISAKKKPA